MPRMTHFVHYTVRDILSRSLISLSCSMGSMPVGVHDVFHEMGPFIPVHRQCVQIADVLVAPVR